MRSAGESVEGTSPAAMAALRMRAMDDWDRPAGTVRHQRTADTWNLQGWPVAATARCQLVTVGDAGAASWQF
jgi:hypothetical protein